MRTQLLNCIRTAHNTYLLTITNGKRRAYRVRKLVADQAYRELHVEAPTSTRPIEIDIGPTQRVLNWELVIPSVGMTSSEYQAYFGEPYVRDDPTLDV